MPFNGFGPDNFLAGTPDFCFEDYKGWINKRFAPRHFQNLKEKMWFPSLYAIGGFIQALEQNPGMEAELKALGTRAHVYIGTGLGNLGTISDATLVLHEAQARWDAFWKDRETDLGEYLRELSEIDSVEIEGEIEAGKLNTIREKEKRRTRLQEKWNSPEPPWRVTANVIWNLHNTPAAQVSILGHLTGLAFAPVAACSTFGVCLKVAMNAIRSGDAKAVVVGATDGPPHPLVVGAFYSARVLAADGHVSIPLTKLQGTHVAGGSVIWIVGDLDYFQSKGFKPLGMELVGVGVTSDAHHIITPSTQGPKEAILEALADASVAPEEIGSWDLHATATPGDYGEVATLRSILPDSVLVTARKGTFGHGMSAGGGWELTAQYLGYQRGTLFPTPLAEHDLNRTIATVHDRYVYDSPAAVPEGLAGKLSMGIGGINACVISRPLDRE
ncbi:MAG TPA: beta-ketoacyl synthase N-terminal-like domain-containing protein [Bryobacteraceae bacterium]|nr:beta-ketoacyl synthase N-terminal-like domain-containing protein [Bryobacteraceae bacterium]